MKLVTKAEFVMRSNEIHKGAYNYDKVSFTRCTDKVVIVCPVHGDYEQKVGDHLAGCGCRKCKYENHRGKTGVQEQEFFDRAKNKHGEKYSYESVVYIGFNDAVKITCPKHGEFHQTPKNHLLHGCPSCGIEKRAASKTLSLDKVLQMFYDVHKELYDYSGVVYENSKKKVKIICRLHGAFNQTIFTHANGHGCPKCADLVRTEKRTYKFEDFEYKAKKKHKDFYSYDSGKNTFCNKKVIVTCPKHGDFEQLRSDHLFGYGCPSCGKQDSKAEVEANDWLLSLGVETERRNRSLIGSELDIYIPSKNFAIEYNGLYYHSDRPGNSCSTSPNQRHKAKTEACKAKGIHLFHLYEDDWLKRPEVVKHTLKHLLGISDKSIYARKTTVKVHTLSEVKDFYEKYHMQGAPYQGVYVYSLYDGEEIVAAMTFSKPSSERGNTEGGRYELLRYACKYSIVGGASKLFKAFVKDYNPSTVVSYSDDGMFTGKMYEVLGFKETEKVRPDYRVIVGKERKHKSGFRREALQRLLGDKFNPDFSERENCHANGLYRIYNSGLTKWEWTLDTHKTL